MARTAAGQVSARGFASGRALMAAALLVIFGHVAEPIRVEAQPVPMGPVQQPPFPSYSPFPSPMPPPAQAQTPVATPAERTDEQRRAAEQYRIRQQAAERKRQLAERKRQLAVRKQQQVERKQQVEREQQQAERKQVAKKRASQRKFAASHQNQREIAESKGYKAVSDLVNFPKFFPGLGIIYVKPDTLPVGPFLCFDREDRLVATVYMIPIKDIDDHKTLEAAGVSAPVDHVSFYFNPGHPGVEMPHYHFVIWHVSKKDEARVAQ